MVGWYVYHYIYLYLPWKQQDWLAIIAVSSVGLLAFLGWDRFIMYLSEKTHFHTIFHTIWIWWMMDNLTMILEILCYDDNLRKFDMCVICKVMMGDGMVVGIWPTHTCIKYWWSLPCKGDRKIKDFVVRMRHCLGLMLNWAIINSTGSNYFKIQMIFFM